MPLAASSSSSAIFLYFCCSVWSFGSKGWSVFGVLDVLFPALLFAEALAGRACFPFALLDLLCLTPALAGRALGLSCGSTATAFAFFPFAVLLSCALLAAASAAATVGSVENEGEASSLIPLDARLEPFFCALALLPRCTGSLGSGCLALVIVPFW